MIYLGLFVAIFLFKVIGVAAILYVAASLGSSDDFEEGL